MVAFKDVCDGYIHTRVNHTEVESIKGNKYRVSTVRLQVDHQYGEGSPIFYETMVFVIKSSDELDYNDLYSKRYATLQEAVIGHGDICKAVEKGELVW